MSSSLSQQTRDPRRATSTLISALVQFRVLGTRILDARLNRIATYTRGATSVDLDFCPINETRRTHDPVTQSARISVTSTAHSWAVLDCTFQQSRAFSVFLFPLRGSASDHLFGLNNLTTTFTSTTHGLIIFWGEAQIYF